MKFFVGDFVHVLVDGYNRRVGIVETDLNPESIAVRMWEAGTSFRRRFDSANLQLYKRNEIYFE